MKSLTKLRGPRAGAVAGVAVWAAMIALAYWWGRALIEGGTRMKLHAPPLFGRFEVRVGPGLLVALAVAILVVARGPQYAARVGWRPLLGVVTFAAATWAVGLALSDGVGALASPLEGPHDYLGAVAQVTSPGEFVAAFTAQLADYPVHVQGHPPGFVLVLWGLERLGLGGPGPAAALVIAVGASASAACMVAVRAMIDESAARRCAPFAVLLPAALWTATSADAFFMGIAAWGIAFLAAARGSVRGSALGGFLLGAGLFLSYGLAPLGILVLAIAAVRRSPTTLLAAAVGALAVVVLFAAAGFWWLDGLAATVERYEAGVSRFRPYSYFLLAGPAAFAVALGPAVAAGLGGLRDARVWALVGPALLVVSVATMSGLSKGEVERIWLPFALWFVPATVALSSTRVWLTAQAGWAMLLQVMVKTPW